MLHILAGPDDYSIAQAIEALKREAGSEAAFFGGVTTLDGQQVTLEQLANACGTAPFFGGKRVIVIKGLLERFEPRTRSSRPPARRTAGTIEGGRQAASNQPRDEHKPFSDCLVNVPDTTLVVLVEGSVNNNNPLLKEVGKKATLKMFPALRADGLRQWVQQQVSRRQASISPQAVELLVRLVGGDLWAMSGEIEKLTLFAAGRSIEESDVRTLVSETQQSDVFDMTDAILEARTEAAARLLQQLLNKGAAPTYLLFMLCRQVRLAIRAKEMVSQRVPEIEIQSRLGVPQFAVRKVIEQAGRHSLDRLKAVYRRLLEADLWIKTGKYDGELAIEVIAAELSQRQQSVPARAGSSKSA